MREYLKDRWVVIAGLAVFIVLKIPHLTIPFYWDECWPYAPAVKAMAHHGISLLPGALEPDLSRGHPLFFHALGGAWIKVFGYSNLSLHCFALMLSVCFLIVVYEAGYRCFNKRVALLAFLLISTRESFFTQSSFVLPEVLVAFLSFLSIYLYARQRYFAATLALTALFLTKESGVIAGFIIGMDAFISVFNRQLSVKQRLQKLMPAFFAGAAMGLFLLLQKHTNGWYVFPLHSDSIKRKWFDIWYQYGTCVLQTLFNQEYEYIYFIALILLAGVAVVRKRYIKGLWLLAILIPFYIIHHAGSYPDIYQFNFHGSTRYPSMAVFLLFGIAYFASLRFFGSKIFYDGDRQQTHLILLLGLFVLCYMYFASVVYFIPRYMMAAITALLFLLAIFLDAMLRNSYPILFYPLTAFIFVFAWHSFKKNQGYSDSDYHFIYGVQTHSAVVDYLESHHLYNRTIGAGGNLERLHLTDKETGFLKGPDTFSHVSWDINSATEYAIFDNIETDTRRDAILSDTTFKLVHLINKGPVWAEIYHNTRFAADTTLPAH